MRVLLVLTFHTKTNITMQITLKNVKIFLPGSQETTNFVADIIVNGIKAGYAENQGHGGPTNYGSYQGATCELLIKNAEEYCLSLPPKEYPELKFTMKMNLENFIDCCIEDEVEKKERQKFEKGMLKDQLKWILFTTIPEGQIITEYSRTGFKEPIAELLARPKGVEAIKKLIAEKTEKGLRVISTNLPTEILNSILCHK